MLINTVKDISRLAVAGFDDWSAHGHVNVEYHPQFPYLKFNYTRKAVYSNAFNNFERLCRGLIINYKTGEIVARPFDKFYEEEPLEYSDMLDVMISEKLDGSLGILYWSPDGETPYITTRGSFTSEQGKVATEMFRNTVKYQDLPRDLTFMFEIIYPENALVVDYGYERSLTLIAVREISNGHLFSHEFIRQLSREYNMRHAPIYDSLDGLMERLNNERKEGVVVTVNGTHIFKMKTEWYKNEARNRQAVSYKRIAEDIRDGSCEEKRKIRPATYGAMLDYLIRVCKEIDEYVVMNFMLTVKFTGSRADFAKKLQEQVHLQPYFPAMFDLYTLGNVHARTSSEHYLNIILRLALDKCKETPLIDE